VPLLDGISLEAIQRSAWKGSSANFALTAFSAVRRSRPEEMDDRVRNEYYSRVIRPATSSIVNSLWTRCTFGFTLKTCILALAEPSVAHLPELIRT
jgi:hypothetical protein